MRILKTIYERLIDIKFWTVLSVIITILSLIPILRSLSNDKIELVYHKSPDKYEAVKDSISFVAFLIDIESYNSDTIRAQIPLSFENPEDYAIDVTYQITDNNYYSYSTSNLQFLFYYYPTTYSQLQPSPTYGMKSIKTLVYSKQTEPVAVAINIPTKQLFDNHHFKADLNIKWIYEKMGSPKSRKLSILFIDSNGVKELYSNLEKNNLPQDVVFVKMLPSSRLTSMHIWLPVI
jgi:hypothetical protein